MLALLQEARQRLNQAEGHQVAEGPMPVTDSVQGDGTHVLDEEVVLVGCGVRGGLLALLAQDADFGGLLQLGGALPGVIVLVSFAATDLSQLKSMEVATQTKRLQLAASSIQE